MSNQIFRDSDSDRQFSASWFTGRVFVYSILLLWAFICLFPIYWTITTSFKMAPDVMKGNIIPWVDFTPKWLGWRSLGLSPETIGIESTVREEFLKRFWNSAIVSVCSSILAVGLGSCAAYGLSRFNYRFGFMRNSDISFFFLIQLILPPVVLALPFLVLYKSLNLLDTRIGLILLYTLTVLPIVIWIMRDQFNAVPIELEEAALVDGASVWGSFFKVVFPIVLPGIASAFILCLILCWNEYFLAALITSTDAKTMPVMVASEISSQSIKWWNMAAISLALCFPLIVAAIFLERYIVKGMAAGAIKG